MSTLQKSVRILTEHNSDGTHNQAAATTLQAKTGWYIGPTTQSDVTGSRALGTVYQNTTGNSMFISVVAHKATAVALAAFTDSSNPPTTQVAVQTEFGVSSLLSVFFVVLNNNYYTVTMSGGTLDNWIEWK